MCAGLVSRISAVANLRSFDETISGTIHFDQDFQHGDGLVQIRGVIDGLPSGEPRALHIYTHGDMSDKCANLGESFNPDGYNHGAPDDNIRYVYLHAFIC